jgi:3-isopropylmalate dehydrogenase
MVEGSPILERRKASKVELLSSGEGISVSKTVKLGVIPGDGIGPEVTKHAVKALSLAAPNLSFDATEFDLGARRYLATGETLSDETLATLSEQDVLLLGAIGDPKVPSGVLERGLLLKLRFGFEHYVNLRPTKLYPGVPSPLANPGDVDFVVVREGTEGLYLGKGESIAKGTKEEVATEVSWNTAQGVERIVRYAFEFAATRERKQLTLVHKHNVLVRAGSLYSETVERIGKEFPQVSHDYLHVDAATIFMVTDPSRFDVIVTDNLFGDILTDLAAAISGGIGLAASGNLNPTGKFPSMFEPVHGSAPDIAGKGIANPTAAIASAAMLLRHIGEAQAATNLEAAIAKDLARGLTNRSTDEIAAGIFENL